MSEILVVSSKVKSFVKENSGGMNTSASIMEALTRIIEQKCREAIESAKREGRKTVMDRDFNA